MQVENGFLRSYSLLFLGKNLSQQRPKYLPKTLIILHYHDFNFLNFMFLNIILLCSPLGKIHLFH